MTKRNIPSAEPLISETPLSDNAQYHRAMLRELMEAGVFLLRLAADDAIAAHKRAEATGVYEPMSDFIGQYERICRSLRLTIMLDHRIARSTPTRVTRSEPPRQQLALAPPAAPAEPKEIVLNRKQRRRLVQAPPTRH